jgi:hypothetical protein
MTDAPGFCGIFILIACGVAGNGDPAIARFTPNGERQVHANGGLPLALKG